MSTIKNAGAQHLSEVCCSILPETAVCAGKKTKKKHDLCDYT